MDEDAVNRWTVETWTELTALLSEDRLVLSPAGSTSLQTHWKQFLDLLLFWNKQTDRPTHPPWKGLEFLSFTCFKHRCSDSDCVCVAAAPILRAQELVEENKTLVSRVQPASGACGPSREVGPSTRLNQGPQPHSGPNRPSNSRENRVRGGRGGRGRRHQETLRPRHPTLLEMVNKHLRLIGTQRFLLHFSFMIKMIWFNSELMGKNTRQHLKLAPGANIIFTSALEFALRANTWS